MVVVMGAQALQLLADGHDSGGNAGTGGAANGLIELFCCRAAIAACSLPRKNRRHRFVPGRVVVAGEAVRRVSGKGRFGAGDPVEGHLLPESDMPEFSKMVWGALSMRRQAVSAGELRV